MRILITGASGSGTTSTGQALAERLGAAFFDADDYYWLPSEPPYQSKRDPALRVAALIEKLRAVPRAVVAGSVVGWGTDFENSFSCVVFLTLVTELRIARLKRRETDRFGLAKVDFLEWAAQYDEGTMSGRSRAIHERWLSERACPVLRLDGDMTTDERVRRVVEALSTPYQASGVKRADGCIARRRGGRP